MHNSITKKIDSLCENRDTAHKFLEAHSPVYKSIVDMNNHFLVSSRKGLSKKDKVLILIGIHATHGTEQSIEFAVSSAVHMGIPDDEIMDALDLALLTGGGTAVAKVQFAANVLAHRKGGGGGSRFDFIDAKVLPVP